MQYLILVISVLSYFSIATNEHWELNSDSISRNHPLFNITINDVYPGQILRCKQLKIDKQTNATIRDRAKLMDGWYGIVMNPATRVNRKSNRWEVRLKWICDETIQLGIKPKHLSIPSKLMIHQFEKGDHDSLAVAKVLYNQLKSNPNNAVFVWPSPSLFYNYGKNGQTLYFDHLPLSDNNLFNNPQFIFEIPSNVTKMAINNIKNALSTEKNMMRQGKHILSALKTIRTTADLRKKFIVSPLSKFNNTKYDERIHHEMIKSIQTRLDTINKIKRQYFKEIYRNPDGTQTLGLLSKAYTYLLSSTAKERAQLLLEQGKIKDVIYECIIRGWMNGNHQSQMHIISDGSIVINELINASAQIHPHVPKLIKDHNMIIVNNIKYQTTFKPPTLPPTSTPTIDSTAPFSKYFDMILPQLLAVKSQNNETNVSSFPSNQNKLPKLYIHQLHQINKSCNCTLSQRLLNDSKKNLVLQYPPQSSNNPNIIYANTLFKFILPFDAGSPIENIMYVLKWMPLEIIRPALRIMPKSVQKAGIKYRLLQNISLDLAAEWFAKELRNVTDYNVSDTEVHIEFGKILGASMAQFVSAKISEYGLLSWMRPPNDYIATVYFRDQLVMAELILYWRFVGEVLGETYNIHVINTSPTAFNESDMNVSWAVHAPKGASFNAAVRYNNDDRIDQCV